ncbi:hypothetical protein LCGC14_3003830, partial [marine sediment metagenome]
TTDADGIWLFIDRALTTDWIVVVTEGTKRFIVDSRNKIQLSELDVSGHLHVDTIYEHTSGSGVTIDSVVLKDGDVVGTIGAATPAAGAFTTVGGSDATDATSKDTGAIIATAGGIAAEKSIWAGSMVMADAQPAFLVVNSVTDTNVTGDGTEVDPVDLDSEIYDIGSTFASDTFTAPVTGKYLITGGIYITDMDGATHTLDALVKTSNRNYRVHFENLLPGTVVPNFGVLVDMDASDTLTLSVTVSGGAKDVDIVGNAAPIATWLAGYLLPS